MELKPAEHLVDLVLTKNAVLPNYALLLGAGASWYSGIKTADEMVEIWRNRLYVRSKTKMKYSDWLTKQDWYGRDDEYGYLFEYLYDERSQRRDYIEKMMEAANPSWGYVYLASLFQAQVFNAVFTTNFDDLINEACYLYTDGVRPIVCAHDALVGNIRLTMTRPKIIKLHGDFLFDSIKNTRSETRKLAMNMEAKFEQFGQEYGLVVVGYGGRDGSVMGILDKLLSNEQYFKHGIYWCLRSNDIPRERVGKLLKKDRVHAIEITGFDELMAMIHNEADLDLPETVVNPMKVAEQRCRIFCTGPTMLLENEIISRDSERVLNGLGKVGKQVGRKVVQVDEMPWTLKVAIMKKKGDWEGAYGYMRSEVGKHKDDLQCSHEYAVILAKLGKAKELKEFLSNSGMDEENQTYFLLFVNDDEAVIEEATGVLKDNPGSFMGRINRAIAYKRLGMIDEMNKDLDIIEERLQGKFYKSGPTVGVATAAAAGVAALKKDKETMLEMLDIAFNEKGLTVEDAKIYPVFEDYHSDKDFKSLVSRREDRSI